MEKLNLLRELLGNPQSSDLVLQFYLDNAKEIICELRHTTDVEPKYATTQIKMAIEMFNKQGVEGQVAHSENSISRSYESADISPSLLRTIIPSVRVLGQPRRIVINEDDGTEQEKDLETEQTNGETNP